MKAFAQHLLVLKTGGDFGSAGSKHKDYLGFEPEIGTSFLRYPDWNCPI